MDAGGRITLSPEAFARFLEVLDEDLVAVPEIVDLFSRSALCPKDSDQVESSSGGGEI